MGNQLKIGIVGTSWWADAMYLPALANQPRAVVTAVCGRDPERVNAFGQRWQVPDIFTDYEKMLDQAELDTVFVISGNDTHYPITMAALGRGLHVLCEKPMALTAAQAEQMVAAARAAGVKTMVPFTYRYMPTTRYVKRLIEEGYIGRPYHLNMRYYTGYGRSSEYLWRFDLGRAGAGALGDIGSHFIYLAEWFFGPISALFCRLGYLGTRPSVDESGQPYDLGDDIALLTLEFANGAQGQLHISTMAYEDTPFGQTHHMEFHGSGGTLTNIIDWDRVQQVHGARQGEGMLRELPVPAEIWGEARRDTVHHTYKDIFRREGWMSAGFVEAILDEKQIRPNFADGARIQMLIEAAQESHRRGGWLSVK